MSRPGRVRLAPELASCWPVVAGALERGRRARLYGAEGQVLAELAGGGTLAARLPAGTGAQPVGGCIPVCRCARGGPARGCLAVRLDGGGAMVFSAGCARVLARAVLAALADHREKMYLEPAGAPVAAVAVAGWRRPALRAKRQAPVDAAVVLEQVMRAYYAYLLALARGEAPARWEVEGKDRFVIGHQRCVDCGRRLSDQVSLQRGRGPVCDRRHWSHRAAFAR